MRRGGCGEREREGGTKKKGRGRGGLETFFQRFCWLFVINPIYSKKFYFPNLKRDLCQKKPKPFVAGKMVFGETGDKKRKGKKWKRAKRKSGGKRTRERKKKFFFLFFPPLENDKWVRVPGERISRIIVKLLNEAHNYPVFLTCHSLTFLKLSSFNRFFHPFVMAFSPFIYLKGNREK